MRPAFALVVLGLLVAGCSASAPSVPTPPEEPPLTATDLYGTVWLDVCGDTQYWIRLDDDQTYEYTAEGPQGPWEKDGTDTWTLEGSILTLSWTNGYRVVSFDLSGGLNGRMDGNSSRPCDGVAYLERAL